MPHLVTRQCGRLLGSKFSSSRPCQPWWWRHCSDDWLWSHPCCQPILLHFEMMWHCALQPKRATCCICCSCHPATMAPSKPINLSNEQCHCQLPACSQCHSWWHCAHDFCLGCNGCQSGWSIAWWCRAREWPSLALAHSTLLLWCGVKMIWTKPSALTLAPAKKCLERSMWRLSFEPFQWHLKCAPWKMCKNMQKRAMCAILRGSSTDTSCHASKCHISELECGDQLHLHSGHRCASKLTPAHRSIVVSFCCFEQSFLFQWPHVCLVSFSEQSWPLCKWLLCSILSLHSSLVLKKMNLIKISSH